MTDFTGFTAETERLRLRTYTDDDFDAFFDLHRREDVARYLPWHPATSGPPGRRSHATRG
jgi:RimJ/RimL family protein N-acetyltransferase